MKPHISIGPSWYDMDNGESLEVGQIKIKIKICVGSREGNMLLCLQSVNRLCSWNNDLPSKLSAQGTMANQ